MSIIKQVPKFKQRSEYLKCASDPVYFLNTYGKVFDAEKQMISDMTCFDYQEDILDDFIDFRFNITLKSRQTGLSVITAGYCAWRLMFGKDERVLIIANDGAGAIRFLETCKQFVDYLPDFLKPPKVGTSIYKTENKKMLQFYNNCQVEAIWWESSDLHFN